MQRRHLTRDEMLRPVGMLQVRTTQRSIAEEIGTKQNVISRLWSRYRATGKVAGKSTGREAHNVSKTRPIIDTCLEKATKYYGHGPQTPVRAPVGSQ